MRLTHCDFLKAAMSFITIMKRNMSKKFISRGKKKKSISVLCLRRKFDRFVGKVAFKKKKFFFFLGDKRNVFGFNGKQRPMKLWKAFLFLDKSCFTA